VRYQDNDPALGICVAVLLGLVVWALLLWLWWIN
jgi:hypothetical protein